MLFSRKCLVPLLIGMVVIGACAEPAPKVRTHGPERASAPVTGGPENSVRVSLPTAPPDLKHALEGVEKLVQTMWPTTTTSSTTVPPPAPHITIPPGPQGGPTPVSSRRCSGAVEAEIVAVFGAAAPYFSSVAWRESNCTPTARNSEGASGLLQLMLPLHNDLFLAVGCNPVTQWSEISCNLRAAKLLYDGAGTSPWR